MSYEFYMAFAKAETISDAYQIAHSFVNSLLPHSRDFSRELGGNFGDSVQHMV